MKLIHKPKPYGCRANQSSQKSVTFNRAGMWEWWLPRPWEKFSRYPTLVYIWENIWKFFKILGTCKKVAFYRYQTEPNDPSWQGWRSHRAAAFILYFQLPCKIYAKIKLLLAWNFPSKPSAIYQKLKFWWQTFATLASARHFCAGLWDSDGLGRVRKILGDAVPLAVTIQ